MKRFLQLLIVCACLSAYSLPALSWGQKGHRVIAKIAYDKIRRSEKAVSSIGQTGRTRSRATPFTRRATTGIFRILTED